VTEPHQDVIGSNGRGQVPNNHSKYRTLVLPSSFSAPVNFECQNAGSRIEPSYSVTRQTFNLHLGGGQESLRGPGCLIHGDARQFDLPLRGLEPGRWRLGKVGNFDHINPIWQGCVKSVSHSVGLDARS
jgi:hypothetical protein